ncbi:MAG: DegT/DnrJ/EryC1/StrS family aminotransferase [Planctomycetes bacterium]|nr:DegT/DnrJ/EryC1/StrS family aminotransferase [Planctomycetota bacterium]
MSATNRISAVALGPDDRAEREEWLAALARVIDANAYCLGPEVAAFEAKVQSLLDVPHAVGLANGTDALRLGLLALGVGAGDEVVVPAFTFFATASSAAHIGARPVFADVDPATLTLAPAALERALTGRTRAIVPVHLYGQAADMAGIARIAGARGIQILEDAAQAFGVRYRGGPLGALGAAGTFSFYPTKNLGAPGDAGMLITRDAALATRVRALRMHGDAGGYRHEHLGWNARMDGFSAAILSLKLDRLAAVQSARSRNAEYYVRAFADRSLGEHVRLLGRTAGSEHCWHQFVIRARSRDALRAHLAARGIDTGLHYPASLPEQSAFAYLGHRRGEFPAAESAGKEVLALPVHHRLREADLARVAAAIAEFYKDAP